jgi:hypothetical protein
LSFDLAARSIEWLATRLKGRVVPAFCRWDSVCGQLGEKQLDVKVEQPGDSNGVQLY